MVAKRLLGRQLRRNRGSLDKKKKREDLSHQAVRRLAKDSTTRIKSEELIRENGER
jgi:hypothetical protein